MSRSSSVSRSIVVLILLVLLATLAATPTVVAHGGGHGKPQTPTAVFFAADGLRQDLVERYADDGLMPTMRSFLRHGAKASGNGMLTQAPPNTGAGWYTLATGAWPGVHGSTNNTLPSISSTRRETAGADWDSCMAMLSIFCKASRCCGPKPGTMREPARVIAELKRASSTGFSR